MNDIIHQQLQADCPFQVEAAFLTMDDVNDALQLFLLPPTPLPLLLLLLLLLPLLPMMLPLLQLLPCVWFLLLWEV